MGSVGFQSRALYRARCRRLALSHSFEIAGIRTGLGCRTSPVSFRRGASNTVRSTAFISLLGVLLTEGKGGVEPGSMHSTLATLYNRGTLHFP